MSGQQPCAQVRQERVIRGQPLQERHACERGLVQMAQDDAPELEGDALQHAGPVVGLDLLLLEVAQDSCGVCVGVGGSMGWG